jgi:uncharacterized protein
MKQTIRPAGCALLLAATLGTSSLPTVVQATDITIGTASRAGVYFQVGRAMCRLVNYNSADHGLRCEPLPTDGSIANLRDLRAGDLDLAIVQSDWQYHATQGTGPFQDTGPDEELRALFSVHGEPFTLVARVDANINSLDDLVGKRVNIGNPGSGQRATMEVVMDAKGWTRRSFALANELPAGEQSLALCHDRVQAMVYTVGHPNDSVNQAVDLCDAVVVEVSDSAIDALVENNPYYAYMDIPGNWYPNNPGPVRSFGVKATVIATTRLDEDDAYAIVKTIFDDLDTFRTLHPAFMTLEPEAMIRDGLSAPLHPGAERYYRERGWLED